MLAISITGCSLDDKKKGTGENSSQTNVEVNQNVNVDYLKDNK